MEIKKGETYRIRAKKTDYFVNKYGIPAPLIIIEAEDTEIWPNGGWGEQQWNPVCLCYAFRAGFGLLPDEGKVYYGHIVIQSGLKIGELVHESELVPLGSGA